MGLIRVKVKLFGTLRRFYPNYNSEKGIDLEIEEGSTMEALIKTLQLPQNEARVLLINGVSKKVTDPIQEGNCINIFAPMGGG
jgi:molybdopterin converting factor small subunit